MKFKIRVGYVAHVAEMVEVATGQFERQTQSFYEGQVADLTADQALDHLHKLEPIGADAVKFCESKFALVQDVAAAGESNLAALVAAGVAQALQALGITAASIAAGAAAAAPAK
jgi:hypothetical protein